MDFSAWEVTVVKDGGPPDTIVTTEVGAAQSHYWSNQSDPMPDEFTFTMRRVSASTLVQ